MRMLFKHKNKPQITYEEHVDNLINVLIDFRKTEDAFKLAEMFKRDLCALDKTKILITEMDITCKHIERCVRNAMNERMKQDGYKPKTVVVREVLSSNRVKTTSPHNCWGCRHEIPPRDSLLCTHVKEDDLEWGCYWCDTCEEYLKRHAIDPRLNSGISYGGIIALDPEGWKKVNKSQK
jgi:hypothetical protein